MTLDEFYKICDAIVPDEYGCHRWPRAIDDKGYGRTKIGKVHRLALERKLGRPIRRGFHALHHCDYKPCVNPDHLYEGTDKDNVRDRSERYPEGAVKGGKACREKYGLPERNSKGQWTKRINL